MFFDLFFKTAWFDLQRMTSMLSILSLAGLLVAAVKAIPKLLLLMYVAMPLCTSSSAETDRLLKSFSESEEPPTANTLTEDDDRALTYFNATHSRLEDGRYEVRAPRRLTVKPLGNSRSQAVRRYNTNKHSLQRKGK